MSVHLSGASTGGERAPSPGLLDPLIDSAAVRRDLGGTSDMTLWRWTEDLGFPPPDVIIARRKFWHRSTVDRWVAAQKRRP